jgi:hypothetical protein
LGWEGSPRPAPLDSRAARWTAAGRPICSCELSPDWRDGVRCTGSCHGVEAGLDPPQPTVGVLGPQCGPQPRSEPGRPSRRRRSIPLSGDRRFSRGERRWISATPRSVVGCSVGNPQNGRRYGGFASRPPQATCNVQAIRSPSRPCEPGELNRGLIGIIFPVGQPAADLHGARPPRLIPVAALDLYLQFYTSKIFPEMLC